MRASTFLFLVLIIFLAGVETARATPTLRFALIGDSLSSGFYVTDQWWRTIQLANSRSIYTSENWFMDNQPPRVKVPGGYVLTPLSLQERLEEWLKKKKFPFDLVFSNFSRAAAFVDGANFSEKTTVDEFFGVQTLSEQIKHVLELGELPHWLGIWIGHNNLDLFDKRFPPKEKDLEAHMEEVARLVSDSYRQQLEGLMGALNARPEIISGEHKMVVVVFGLINFRSFLRARAGIKKDIDRAPETQGYLRRRFEIAPHEFPTLEKAPEKLATLADWVSRGQPEEYKDGIPGLKEIVRSYKDEAKIRVRYSNALSEVNIDEPYNLTLEDMWHASPRGHSNLAKAVWEEKVLKDSKPRRAFFEDLEHLGVEF